MSSPYRRCYLPWPFRWLAVLVVRALYRVQAQHWERIPATGGVLIASNHLSYVDPALLQLACPRPIRFVGYEGLMRQSWFFRLVFRLTGTIPITPANALETTRRVVRSLQAGEVVAVFVEGGISRTGQLMRIRRGFELMAQRAGVPVVPVAIDGIWGSVFSFSGQKILFKSPRLMRTHVCVAWGEPVPAAQVDALRVRRALLDLGHEAFEQRPQLRRHLAYEVVRSLAKRPGEVQIIDRTADRREVSCGKLLAVAAALSRHLRRTVPGRRVGIVLPPGAGAAIANLAVLCAGKTPVNLNFTAGRAAIEASLRLGEIETVISAEAVQKKVPGFPWPEKTLDLKTVITGLGKGPILAWLLAVRLLPNQLLPRLLRVPRRGDRTEAGLLFTSGSSGEPKGVVLTHRNILANCWQISSLSILPASATLVGCLPIFHSFGFTVTLWYPMIRGCHVVTLPSPLETGKIVAAIKEENATVMIGAPTFLRPMVRKAEPGELRSLELVVSGAEKMPMEFYEAMQERHHIEVMQGYGLTETTPVTNVNQHHPPVLTDTGELQEGKRLGSVGRMMPGMTARIVDPDTWQELPLGSTGMLLFKGPNVFPGYLADEAKTAAAFRDGWFVTGDLGRFDEDGFLFIEGRLSRFSKIGGEMVPHGTVEQKIAEAFDLDQSEGPQVFVVGVPDATKGEALVLLAAFDVTVDELREKLAAAGLPNLWVPKVVRRVDKIPQLGTGKTDLKSCKALATAPA